MTKEYRYMMLYVSRRCMEKNSLASSISLTFSHFNISLPAQIIPPSTISSFLWLHVALVPTIMVFDTFLRIVQDA